MREISAGEKKRKKICHEIDKDAGGAGRDGRRVREKTGVALRGGYTFRVQAYRSGYVLTYIYRV